MNIHVVYAFTKNGAGGNPAGVVLCNTPLSSDQMQHIAANAGYSETAFIEIISQNTQRIRFFAPSKEVALCGHATIASYSWLFQKQHIAKGKHNMLCMAGAQKIIVNEDGSISMSQNLPTFGPTLQPDDISHALRIHPNQIHSTIPIQVASTGLHKIFVPLQSISDLNAISPNQEEIKRVSIQNNSIGMYCYTLETLHSSTAHCRNFAPVVGIMEDSATGTSAAALSTLLHHFGLLSDHPNLNLSYEQGYAIDTPSEIYVRLEQRDKKITAVWVRGFAHFS
ncbi:MAG: phenazine biosynthesis protein PhzF [Deltaproteobacteria bacterium]|nr:phenazine biosynthesis protein PhzF [Deltaproteobacteria bacterium]